LKQFAHIPKTVSLGAFPIKILAASFPKSFDRAKSSWYPMQWQICRPHLFGVQQAYVKIFKKWIKLLSELRSFNFWLSPRETKIRRFPNLACDDNTVAWIAPYFTAYTGISNRFYSYHLWIFKIQNFSKILEFLNFSCGIQGTRIWIAT